MNQLTLLKTSDPAGNRTPVTGVRGIRLKRHLTFNLL